MVHSRTLAKVALEMVQKPNAEESIEAFLTYLKNNNLIGLLPQVLDHIDRITARQSESDVLQIRSKYELNNTDVSYIKKVTGAEDAKVTQHIDESVIGGFSASYAGYLYDGSLENQVNRLRNMLIKS
ncbi:MAG: F0F1 ATP synthase subunit delta [Candidatus Pacebacteria bacterium]|nr:F0F1 ATP synthase subunit delta [Candidatus Paceibacterota bacterium]